jgi:hypothetical protein
LSETLTSTEPTETEIRAAVGPNVEYYARKWLATEGGGFNWAAFFLAGLWLPFRKMYWATAILYSFVIAESLAEELLFVEWLGLPETPRVLERGLSMAICGLCGALGNRWYRTHVRDLIANVRAQVPDETARAAELTRRGGTSLLAALGWSVLFVVLLIGTFVLEELVLGTEP